MVLLRHPELVNRTCEVCKAYMFHDGEQLSGELLLRGRPGEKRPVKRPAGKEPPCNLCPKRNPIDGAAVDRDLHKTREVYRIYNRIQATSGRCLDDEDAADELTGELLAIAAPVIRYCEQRKVNEPLEQSIAAAGLTTAVRRALR